MVHSERPPGSEEPDKKEKIAIIGGGITGLFIGYFLVNKGYKISLFEKEKYAGGALSTFAINNDIVVEKFYHHILSFNKELLSFLKKAGFSDSLIRNNCPIGIIKDATVLPINSLRQIGVLRDMTFGELLKSCWLGINILLFPKSKKWDAVTAEELITSFCGANIWNKMCYPMIRAKFGDKYTDISGQWLVNKLRQKILIRKENSGEKLFYLKGSFQELIDYLEKHIRQSGSRICFQSPVEEILTEDNTVSGLKIQGKNYLFDKVVSTIAEPEIHRLIEMSFEREDPPGSDVIYSHSLCTVMRLKKKLSNFYWLYNLDEKIPMAAIIEHTNLTGQDLYNDESILYIARYVSSKKELYQSSDEDIINEYIPYLNRIFKEFDIKDIIQSYVFRQPNAQPIFDKGYLDKKPPQQSKLSGLYSVNMSQLFPQGRTLENCYLLARKFTDRF